MKNYPNAIRTIALIYTAGKAVTVSFGAADGGTNVSASFHILLTTFLLLTLLCFVIEFSIRVVARLLRSGLPFRLYLTSTMSMTGNIAPTSKPTSNGSPNLRKSVLHSLYRRRWSDRGAGVMLLLTRPSRH